MRGFMARCYLCLLCRSWIWWDYSRRCSK